MSDSQKGAEGFTAHEEEPEVEGHGFNGAEGAEGFLGAEGFQATGDEEPEVEGHGFNGAEGAEGFLGAEGAEATSDDDVEAHLFERPEGFEGYENAK
jgi:hypothetical protein